MADMGFLPEVKRLLDRTPSDRQTLLFSATLDGDVDVLTSRYQRNPVRHEVASDPDEVDRAEHHFMDVERADRVAATARLVREHGPTVVFTRTKHGADRVARQLARSGVQAAVVHGNRSQGQRDRALQEFHAGRAEVLVATDVAARGIHVDDVACVVHFDPPEDPKDYVHRSGRTARAGSSGGVVTLVPPEVRAKVKVLQRSLGYPAGTGTGPVAPDAPVVRRVVAAPAGGTGGTGGGGGGRPRRPEGEHRSGRSRRTARGAGSGARGGTARSGSSARSSDARGAREDRPSGGRGQGRAASAAGTPVGRGGAEKRSGAGASAGAGRSRRRSGGAPAGRGAGRPR
jgi:superfamily II DNA/RNA helicase